MRGVAVLFAVGAAARSRSHALGLGLPVDLAHLQLAGEEVVDHLARDVPARRLLDLRHVELKRGVDPIQELLAPHEVRRVHHAYRLVRGFGHGGGVEGGGVVVMCYWRVGSRR